MCTAITYQTGDFYFGRTLDHDCSYGEEIVITPRNYPIRFRKAGEAKRHYAVIGMAHVEENYPLYYDAVNEKGLCIAGLNFAGSAVYRQYSEGKVHLASFELIPYLLGSCATVDEAEKALLKINLTDEAYSPALQPMGLHWMIADKRRCIVLEAVSEGMKIHCDPVGVLTNNPPFEMQMRYLESFMGLSPKQAENRFSASLSLSPDSRGMGAIGLPGDLSSRSRFVRAAFVRLNSVSGSGEAESVRQFFHILGSVEQVRGCNIVKNGVYEITEYTSCCNADKGIYYYTTYENPTPNAVGLFREDLDTVSLKRYPVLRSGKIAFQN